MRVEIDQVWASRTVLHARVVVWGKNDAWRTKHYVALPFSEIPEEALAPLLSAAADRAPSQLETDEPLF